MNANLARQFAALRDGWITGGRSAASLVPEDWREFIAGADAEESERRLAALAGQVWDVAFRPALPGDAGRLRDLPPLALPAIPERLRPLFRRAMSNAREPGLADKAEDADRHVLRLIERRGFAAHPLDWFPSAAAENVPDLYAPWQDWMAAAQATGEDEGGGEFIEELTEESWDHFYPAQRRLLLKALRRQSPDRARAIVAARAGRESAEQRLALVETLEIGLAEADAPYLQSLANDRSGKVKTLAARFLARLRHRSEGAPDEELKEFAAFFEIGGKGFFKRARTVGASPLKSQARAERRMKLFGQYSFVELVSALDLSEAEFIDGWRFGLREGWVPVDYCLAQMVLESAADESVARFAGRLLAEDDPDQDLLRLLPRLDRALCVQVMKKILAGPGLAIGRLSRIDHGDLAGPGDVLDSPAYETLQAEIRKEQESGWHTTRALCLLNALAGVASAEAARVVFEDVARVFGLFPVNSPALAFLRLNFELARAAGQETDDRGQKTEKFAASP
jgi:hypothetical protein